MGPKASQITSLTIVYSIVYSDADQRKKSKLRVTGLSAGDSTGTGEFPAQMTSYAEIIPLDECEWINAKTSHHIQQKIHQVN